MRIASSIFFVLILIAGCGGGGSSTKFPVSQYTFAVFGDNRSADAGTAQPAVFIKILKSMKTQHTVFALNAGDSINSLPNDDKYKAAYDEYSSDIRSFYGGKVYLAIGNHDVEGISARQNFFRYKDGGLFYSFDYLNSHFIVLDSEIIGQQNLITGDQLNWLKNDLQKSSKAAHRFVFLHKPLYPVDGHSGHSMDIYPADRDALHKLFADNNIDIVFNGHEHVFYDMTKDGVRYIITGGAGSPLYTANDGTGSYHHYVLVHVTGEKLSFDVIKMKD